MKTIRFHVTGATPLLMNSPKGMAAPTASGTTATKRIPSPADEAESGTYRLPDGSLGWPAMAFRSAMQFGATGFKFGKRGAPSVVKGSVFVVGEWVELLDPKTGKKIKDYAVDTRRCCLGSAGRKVAIMRSRPRIDSWSCYVEFDYDERFIDETAIVQTFERAGATIGIGNFRPQLSGPYGRFTVAVEK